MKTNTEILEMYEKAKSYFLNAKNELEKNINSDDFTMYRFNILSDNVSYYGQQLRILEAICQIPEEQRLMNPNKLKIEEV